MGTYLSQPILDKHECNGEVLHCSQEPLTWGCVEMQGWRKSMEDSHVAATEVSPPQRVLHRIRPPTGPGDVDDDEEEDSERVLIPAPNYNSKVFAVFDGHGGPEVARFCDRHLVNVLVSQKGWNEGNLGEALVETFHMLDRMIDDPSNINELTRLKTQATVPSPVECDMNGQTPPSASEDDAESAPSPPVQRRGQKEKSPPDKSPEKTNCVDQEMATSDVTAAAAATVSPPSSEPSHAFNEPNDGAVNEEMEEETSQPCEESPLPLLPSAPISDVDNGDDVISNVTDEIMNETDADVTTEKKTDAVIAQTTKSMNGALDTERYPGNTDPSIKEVDGTNTKPATISAADAMVIFHKLMAMSGGSGAKQPNSQQIESSAANVAEDATDYSQYCSNGNEKMERQPNSSMTLTKSPTRVQNGRQVCNLPDHPIHAGCTSVVVVMVNRLVTVANAGDSRAVLCRAGGGTEPLSFDHKPFQEREMNRILRAGGFVNQFGRVNGNLNLSRSIGDLKYKQTAGLPPPAQMITAEPDIMQVLLGPLDEFIIIGCDGIWDCLSNEEAVLYVRNRIETMHPSDIGKQMLDDIVSKDPRASQGIGGDNMTCLIIDLLPSKRTYRASSSSKE